MVLFLAAKSVSVSPLELGVCCFKEWIRPPECWKIPGHSPLADSERRCLFGTCVYSGSRPSWDYLPFLPLGSLRHQYILIQMSPFYLGQFKQISVTCDWRNPKVNFTFIMAWGTSPASEAVFLHVTEIKMLSPTWCQKVTCQQGQQKTGKPSGHSCPATRTHPATTLMVVGTPTLCCRFRQSLKARLSDPFKAPSVQ